MSRTVLIADDESPIRDFVGEVLIAAGFDVRFATDGLDALDQALSERPDLVLTDFRMPRLDGLGLATRLRESDQSLPILMMSATPPNLDDLDIGVIRKPFNIPLLVDAVEDALALTA
jgi:DNA-binding response OmpR family regulator